MQKLWLVLIGFFSLALCACVTVNGDFSSSANVSVNTSASPGPTPMPTPSVSPTPYTVCDELTYPSDIAINDSLIVVTEPSPGFLTKIFPDGRTGAHAKGLTYPSRITPYGLGFAFLSQADSKIIISQINANGTISIIAEMEDWVGIRDIAADGDDILATFSNFGFDPQTGNYRSGSGIYRISKDGKLKTICNNIFGRERILVYNSEIYLGNDVGISKLNPDGTFSGVAGGVQGMSDFALDNQNIVMSSNDGAIYQASKTGTVTRIAKKLGSLGGIALKGNEIYVVDISGCRLLRVTL